jgi:regulator of cell morphogenesis and NO signaling
MTTIDTSTTVGDLVTAQPGSSRVFMKHGIDFCCGGKRTLEAACQEQGLDPAAVVAELAAIPPEPRNDLADAPLEAVCDYIERTHHDFTRAELDRVGALLEKVARVHGTRHPSMVELSVIFALFAEDLRNHMLKEERVLFPAIRALAHGNPGRDPHAPISVMEREHVEAGDALRRMRALGYDYVPPEGACNTFRAALGGLADIESDLLRHVHLENNILFPRALALVS